MPPKAFLDCERDLNINLSSKIFDDCFPAFLISTLMLLSLLNKNKKLLIGNFSRSGQVKITIEKNQSGNSTQLIVSD